VHRITDKIPPLWRLVRSRLIGGCPSLVLKHGGEAERLRPKELERSGRRRVCRASINQWT